MSSAARHVTDYPFQGPGEMRARCQRLDWSTTPLGPLISWPQSLRTAAQMVLASPFPNIVLWGIELIQIYNDGYRQLMGNKHPAGLGQPTQQCWPEVWHINQPLYQRVWAGESVAFADALYPITRSGQLEDAWFTLAYSPVLGESGQTAGILVSVVETTSRLKQEHHQEQALQKSEEQYRTLFESMDEGFHISELMYNQAGQPIDWRYLEVNPAFEEQTGLVNVVGRLGSETTPNTEAYWLQAYDQVVQTGQALRLENYNQDTNRWYTAYACRVGRAGSQQFAVIFADITPRKQAEENLRQAARQKDEFLAMLAHELRNPLAPVHNGLQLLAQTHSADPLLEALLPVMNRQMDHLMHMVDDLLDVSRISLGRIHLRTERLDLTQLISQTVEEMRTTFSHSGRQLTAQLPDHPLYLEGDATRLTQVVTNLLTNGLRYTHPDGQVWLSLTPVGEQAVLRVRDNGIGLAADQREAIFEMFVQVDTLLARSYGGLGLGLALVADLVRRHGGRVEAHSPGLEQGSEFVVYLPIL